MGLEGRDHPIQGIGTGERRVEVSAQQLRVDQLFHERTGLPQFHLQVPGQAGAEFLQRRPSLRVLKHEVEVRCGLRGFKVVGTPPPARGLPALQVAVPAAVQVETRVGPVAQHGPHLERVGRAHGPGDADRVAEQAVAAFRGHPGVSME